MPVIETPEHIAAAKKATREVNAMFLTSIMEGRYIDEYLKQEGANAPKVQPGDMAAIGSPLDFVALNVYTPEWVRADAKRLRQILINLLGNAVRFTDAGSITLQVDWRREVARFEVIDTGIGIAPEFLPHVFERFRQADSSTTRRHGGLGLGLAIVKQLTELQGGSVRAKQRP